MKMKEYQVNSPEMKRFIKKHRHLWWWVPEDKKEHLKPASVVEALLTYGDVKDVKELFDLLGIKHLFCAVQFIFQFGIT